MKRTPLIKKKCKFEGCENYPEMSMKGYCSIHADPDVKTKVITKRQQQDRKRRNLVNLKRKVYSAQSKVKLPYEPKNRQNKPMPKVSEKMAKELRKYAVQKKEYLKEHPKCECGINGCKRNSEDIHHKKGRIGKLLNDMRYWLATARICHKWIEEHPGEAKKLGLSLSRLNQ